MIRKATLNDLAAIEQIAIAAYSKYVPRIGKKPAPMVADFAAQIEAGVIYVDSEQQQIVAFVVFYPRGDHIHLENLAVRPESQGVGTGKRLALFVEKIAKRQGFKFIELYTNAAMWENFDFYRHLGYREVGRGIEDGFDRIFYGKALFTSDNTATAPAAS